MIILLKRTKEKENNNLNKRRFKHLLFFYFRTFILQMKGLPKKERLSSKIKIEQLFEEKNTFVQEHIKVYWNVVNSENNNISVLFSVPKKIVPLASNRNKIRRLIKEAYRINKSILTQNKEELNLAFICLSSNFDKFNDIEEKIKLILHRLNQEI